MRALMIAAALAFTAAAPLAQAQPNDEGKTPSPNAAQCGGPDGKFATNPRCKGAGAAPAASSVYRRDAKGHCRDAKGKMVKASHCRTAAPAG